MSGILVHILALADGVTVPEPPLILLLLPLLMFYGFWRPDRRSRVLEGDDAGEQEDAATPPVVSPPMPPHFPGIPPRLK